MDTQLRRGLAFRRAAGREISRAMDRAVREAMRWGVDDCALWIGAIIRDARGLDEFGRSRDPAAGYRRRYATRRGAHRVMGPRGLLGVARAMEREDGWRRLARPGDARIGDVGLARLGGTVSSVIRWRGGYWVGRSERGFTAVPTRDARRRPVVVVAWSVDG